MATIGNSRSLEVRKRLSHPVVDGDGHTTEFMPAVHDYISRLGGPRMLERYFEWERTRGFWAWYNYTPEQRRETRPMRPIWWSRTPNTLDQATMMFPNLLRERLDETGIDFTILFPSIGLTAMRPEDPDLRQCAIRAFNSYHADIYREHQSRMTPVAVIPINTPQEAIAELEYSVKTLGYKAVCFPDWVPRPIPYMARKYGVADATRFAYWLDFMSVDSEYDYDPVWQKCLELKVAPAFHGQGFFGGRTSITNFMHNHIGQFAAAHEAVCRGLFFAGVTRRFPQLNFSFLEGGVGWACVLYSDLFEHFEKRCIEAIPKYNPANIDLKLFLEMAHKYGGEAVQGRLTERFIEMLTWRGRHEDPALMDEFARCQIHHKREIKDLFVPHFFFGCEADDPISAWAFDRKKNRYQAKLNAFFSSDIGHWDVWDIRDVTAEAYEMVEHGLLNEDEFRDFMFNHAVRCWGQVNPDFFRGTVVENEAAALLRDSLKPIPAAA